MADIKQYVTVDQCKSWSRVPFTDDDDLIQQMIYAAQETLANDLQRPLTDCMESDGTTLVYPLQLAIFLLVATDYANREGIAYAQPYYLNTYRHKIMPYIKLQ